jgi:hypothetical protein
LPVILPEVQREWLFEVHVNDRTTRVDRRAAPAAGLAAFLAVAG